MFTVSYALQSWPALGYSTVEYDAHTLFQNSYFLLTVHNLLFCSLNSGATIACCWTENHLATDTTHNLLFHSIYPISPNV